ncbi:hypothetical protein HMPREF9999_00070 [Alloprevotella sp. oral taxon 473 str. F0040]|nr:hypothetical protein HMPREF9999_00070 [Alloprevotella sp. oral taxon 473 str. F0040]
MILRKSIKTKKGWGVLFRKVVSNAKIFLLSIKYGFRSADVAKMFMKWSDLIK